MLGVAAEPDFLRQMRTDVAGEVTQYGIAEQWCAPVATYDSPIGFGEQTWVEAMPDSVLAWKRWGTEVTCEWGAQRGRRITGPTHVTLQTKGARAHYVCPGEVNFGHFVIVPALLDHVVERLTGRSSGDGILRDDLISIDDPVLRQHLGDYVARSCAHPTRLEMEARAVLVIERLLTRHHGLGAPAETAFVDWRLARAIDYLEARLDDDVALRELADIADVSSSHLAALFRAGTGEPPHRWLMRRRFERACQMLADPRASITEVAHACGFASSQHLATVFRRRLGVTPGAYRRGRLK